MHAMADRRGKHSRDKVAVVENPLRLAIVSTLTIRPATAAQVAKELDVPAEKVRYHLRWLRNAGLADVKEKSRHGGVTENVYCVDPRKYVIEKSELARFSSGRTDLAYVRLLRLIFREAMQATRAGPHAKRSEHILLRFLFPLDEQGWENALAIHSRVTDEVLEVREESQARLEAGQGDEILARVATLFFESPGKPSA